MKQTYPLRAPKTLAAHNGLERPSAFLDCSSLVALEWSQHFFAIEGGPKPQPAVVIRLALEHLASHLSTLDTPEAIRAALVKLNQCAKGTGSARVLTEARARLEATEGRPVPFREVRYSPLQLKEQRELMEALERHMGHLQ